MSLRAVVTAGGRSGGELAAAMGTRRKALAPLRGRHAIDLVLAAISDAGVTEIAVVAPHEVRVHVAGHAVTIIEAEEDGGANVLRALAAWPGDDLLYVTCDLPYLSGAALRAFVAGAGDADLAMALATPAAYAVRFPDAPAHTVMLAEGPVVNGSVFLIRAAAAPRIREFATRFFAARKSLWRLALLLGPRLALWYAAGRLDIAAIEAEAQRRLPGVRVRAVRDADPGLCFDIDTIDDFRYAADHP